jgi:hypothetical protein
LDTLNDAKKAPLLVRRFELLSLGVLDEAFKCLALLFLRFAVEICFLR